MDLLPLAVSSVIFLLVSVFWCSWILNNSRTGLPPGPRGLPILGYLPFLDRNLHLQFTILARKYGPIYKLWLGSKLCIVISSPSLIKQVVRDQDTVFANRDPTIAALLGLGGVDIINSPYGPYWRNLRKLFAREMLSNANLDASYVLRRNEVRRAIRNVHEKMGTGVDIGELIFVTELNVVLSLLWGGTFDGEKRDRIGAEFREKMSKFVELLEKPNLSDFLPVLARFDFQGIVKEMKDLMPSFDEILDYVINDRLKIMDSEQVEEEQPGAKRGKDFVQIRLDLKEQNAAEESMTLIQIKALLMDIIVGGTETTATIVEWAMAEIFHNPHVMRTVQQELDDVVGLNDTVEESHMPKLHYLDAVIKETFRLHPPLPLLIPRLPSRSSVLGGYTIPKGSRVILNVWSNYKDPLVWENPSEFKPERFLNNTNKWDYMGNNFHYLPFGSGRRLCPGLPLAERMVMYLLASFLHSFEWRLPEGENLDLAEKFGLVMKKSKPLVAIPSLRLPDLNM
ncbi:UNVERIFIED_CONTAM: Labd-13Z-ene-9,15,16-triol synthase, chloroplastic [Sesamum radiatum]|uniref:Labd-13Z-ene-9,15,16-triol synthase, chloroplastic n=1 Tax=Sesamum radiatum TaxID=300843 RepID=A0AAW2L0L5_SESRA